ncbi:MULTISPECIES: hypothetical protein [unclassified Leptolyngbya]|uniref:hypothetical protein n=1 Tax=unclassified Leptolyngbya TaxID=2650499 RepID=UPI0016849374|nr:MULTISPECIES: hypothetical protein [unclassified Leptolyngbya]MBD1913781.1 hypothetical protein [Leptolyngbya sp. FACHB-8]MBD2156135.1 hypothetical protein [Leptolyngbya sp. FACHB-16]
MSTSIDTTQHQNYLQNAETEFSRLSQQVDAYRKRAQHAKATFSAVYQVELEHLSVKRNTVQRKLQRLQQANNAHWNELQQDFEQAWNELNDAYLRAIASFERA